MVKKETKNYQTPTIKVVRFMTEIGYGLSGSQDGDATTDFISDEPLPQNNQYIQNDSWGTFSEL